MTANRRSRGNSLAEMPATMMLLFIGLLIPCIGLVAYGYRASLMYFCTRDTCYKAAKAPTFTLAKSMAATTWADDLKRWPGNSGTEATYLIVHPLSGGADTVSQSPLPAPPDTGKNVYFIRIVTVSSIPPIFGGKWLGQAIPGLTTAYLLQMNYQYFAENPQGMTE